MSTIGKEGRLVKPGGPDRGGVVSASEQRNLTEGFRPPWQMSYSELCQQPIVLYRGKRTEAEAVNGLNWTQMLNVVVSYSDLNRRNIFKVTFDNPATLAHLIADDSGMGYFHLQQPLENLVRVTGEEREANFERVVYYDKKGIREQILFPLDHKKLDDGKRVVYRPLALWIAGIEIARKLGESVPEEVVKEYNKVKQLNNFDWDKYESDNNMFNLQ